MAQEITTKMFAVAMEQDELNGYSAEKEERQPEDIFIDRPLSDQTQFTEVNGHYLPDDDEDEDEEEDDLILGDEDDLDEDDLDEDDIDVEIDDDIDEDVDEDDLVLDVDDDDEEDEDDDL